MASGDSRRPLSSPDIVLGSSGQTIHSPWPDEDEAGRTLGDEGEVNRDLGGKEREDVAVHGM